MIIVRLAGGMGNQMFQYALGRALAKKHGVPIGLDLTYLLERVERPSWLHFVFRNYDLDIFNIEATIVSPSQIPWLYRPYFKGKWMLYFDAVRRKILKFPGTEKAYTFDASVFSLGPNSYIQGDWQSPKYFDSIEETLRKEFTLKKPLSVKGETLKQEIVGCASVCINVRRADFVTSSLHGTFDKDYYDKGISHIVLTHKIDKIYVFSDDMTWCQENLHFDFPTTFVGHEYAGAKFEEYLMLMSACKYFIIPNSSFAWWAAWLNTDSDKIVIAPKRWFLDPTIQTEDLIPSAWIRI